MLLWNIVDLAPTFGGIKIMTMLDKLRKRSEEGNKRSAITSFPLSGAYWIERDQIVENLDARMEGAINLSSSLSQPY